MVILRPDQKGQGDLRPWTASLRGVPLVAGDLADGRPGDPVGLLGRNRLLPASRPRRAGGLKKLRASLQFPAMQKMFCANC